MNKNTLMKNSTATASLLLALAIVSCGKGSNRDGVDTPRGSAPKAIEPPAELLPCDEALNKRAEDLRNHVNAGLAGGTISETDAAPLKRLASETDKIALFDGVEAMIAQLVASGVRIAIVTSNAEVNVRAILGPKIVAQIDMFECGASLFGKARRFRRVLRKLGVDKADVLAIGDETRDIVAANKVGVDKAAVLWGYANRAILTALKPEMLFDSPTDVLDFMLTKPRETAA
jgi:phosphoglycolate phosphatase-like HAD superfamily hydrolase